MDCTLELSLECSTILTNKSHTESTWKSEKKPTWRCTEGRKESYRDETTVKCTKIPTYYCDSLWEVQPDGTKVSFYKSLIFIF